jgi:hypothetical protein
MIEKNPFEKMGEEEQDQKEQQEHDQSAFTTWQAVLSFITLEVLGKEVYDYFTKHKPDFAEVGPNETPIGLKITDWEKYLFRLADSVAVYVRKNSCFLPSQQVEEFGSTAKSIGMLFWAALKLNHKETWGKSIGLRKLGDEDYVLVELPEQPQNPFGKLFGFPMPGGQK